ncbi:MAG: ABC transporter ATP-binding protein [Actinobacteria bacterium]|nr:ABC transporter ATP-binding protein [Actinomycetota bacterium]
MLEVEDVSVDIGGYHVLDSVSLEVMSGELVCLLGANGAGKSTLMRTIAGLVKPSGGTIILDCEDITGLKAERIVRRGVALCPEKRHLFPRLPVKKNLSLGAYAKHFNVKVMEECYDFAYELFPVLRERGEQLAGTLSGGEQQMLAIARALMSKPQLLLLDEPSLGLAPLVVESIREKIVQIVAAGTTVLLSEQNAGIALSISSRGYVMESGRVVLEGDSESLGSDPEVKKAYLGI